MAVQGAMSVVKVNVGTHGPKNHDAGAGGSRASKGFYEDYSDYKRPASSREGVALISNAAEYVMHDAMDELERRSFQILVTGEDGSPMWRDGVVSRAFRNGTTKEGMARIRVLPNNNSADQKEGYSQTVPIEKLNEDGRAGRFRWLIGGEPKVENVFYGAQ